MRDENSYKGLVDMIVWCKSRARRPIQRVVEIGSFAGESGFIFACHFPEVHCVDPWDYRDDGTYGQGVDLASIEQGFDRMAEQFPLTVLKHKGPSLGVASSWVVPVDLLYIDGDHSLEACWADICSWSRYISKGGFLCGHDYGDHRYPGVEEAVSRIARSPEVFRDRSWAWQMA